MAFRPEPKTKVLLRSSPGYASMPPALQFVYAVLFLIVGDSGLRMLMAAQNRELELEKLKLLRSEKMTAWADISHALRGFYGLTAILIVLDEVLCLEISNLARQLKFKPEIIDDRYVINHMTASLWFRILELTIVSSPSSWKRPIHDPRNIAYAENQRVPMLYRLTQERERWPFLTPRLESVGDKTKETAPALINRVREFMQNQLEQAEKKGLTVEISVSWT